MALIRIALDAMGGDHGPGVVIPAALHMLKKHADLHILLVGDQPTLENLLTEHGYTGDARLMVVHATEVVEMTEPPAQALRGKKDSSMRVAINLVKEGRADACVSCGNTGALMATARFVLKMLEGIDRPAIIGNFPTVEPHKKVWMLDLGANVDSTVEHLFQFAVMGSVLVSSIGGIAKPRVGLLNNGKEDIKGNELVKETAKILQTMPALNYIGYVEADDIFNGNVDVVVCDGFVGNVSLKACEAVAKFIGHSMKEEFQRNWLTKLAGLAALPVLKALVKRIDPSRYNGAALLGLQGVVVKSHGSAKTMAIANAIGEAMLEVRNAVPVRISAEVSQLLQQRGQAQ